MIPKIDIHEQPSVSNDGVIYAMYFFFTIEPLRLEKIVPWLTDFYKHLINDINAHENIEEATTVGHHILDSKVRFVHKMVKIASSFNSQLRPFP